MPHASVALIVHCRTALTRFFCVRKYGEAMDNTIHKIMSAANVISVVGILLKLIFFVFILLSSCCVVHDLLLSGFLPRNVRANLSVAHDIDAVAHSQNFRQLR